MKNYEKLLIFMLVITVITSILTVSVCAEETNTYFLFRQSHHQIIDTTTGENVYGDLKYGVTYSAESHSSTYYHLCGKLIENDNSTRFALSPNTSIDNPQIWYASDIGTKFGGFDNLSNTSLGAVKVYYFKVIAPCDGSTCPATDMNYDNICDDCGAPFTFNLRNDTYNFNGFYLPSAIEDESGTIVNLNNYWNETLSKNEGNLVILNGESTDNALLYHFSPDVVFSDGQVVTTGKTEVTLYKPSTNENGYLYWKKSATDTWNTIGALVASVEHVDWVANAVTDENGYTAINGDVNFQTPLWVEIQGVTEGEMTAQLPKMGGTMKILVVCGVGLMACLVVLSLFGKRSLISRN